MSAPVATATANLTEKDIASSLLSTSKSCCEKLCIATLEAASPDLHRLFKATLEKEIGMQRKIYDFMHARKWYDPYTPPAQMAANDLGEAQTALS